MVVEDGQLGTDPMEVDGVYMAAPSWKAGRMRN